MFSCKCTLAGPKRGITHVHVLHVPALPCNLSHCIASLKPQHTVFRSTLCGLHVPASRTPAGLQPYKYNQVPKQYIVVQQSGDQTSTISMHGARNCHNLVLVVFEGDRTPQHESCDIFHKAKCVAVNASPHSSDNATRDVDRSPTASWCPLYQH